MITLTTKSIVRVDSAEVTAAVGAANVRNLIRAGGILRKTARNSIPFRKRRTTVSKPNGPPNAHRRGKGIKTILYGYDRKSHSLVVGFAKLGNVAGRDVPKRLEAGGRARVKVFAGGTSRRKGKKRGRGGRFESQRKRSPSEVRRIREHYQGKRSAGRTITVKVRKRPTMVPALDKTVPTLPALWADTVKPTTLY